jgi:hypothetical protein
VEQRTGTDNRHAWNGIVLVDTGQLHIVGVVGDVHECRVDHLIIDCVLCHVTHAPGTGVEVVDEEGAHLALLDNISSLTVTLADQTCRLTGVSGLKLTYTGVRNLF